MNYDLQERKVIVTGAATGIGKATAEALIAAGASVALWDTNQAACAPLVEKANAKAIALEEDVAISSSVESAMKQSVEALGSVDGAFNNAGIGIDTVPLEAVEEADFDTIVSINIKGVWLCMKSQLTHMKANGGGAIVNNASVAGLVGLAMQGAYSGTKHAVIGMTKAAAVEAAPEQVRVNAICPGYLDTEMTQSSIANIAEKTGLSSEQAAEKLHSFSPQKRLFTADEVAQAALYLASPAASGINGQALSIDGGETW